MGLQKSEEGGEEGGVLEEVLALAVCWELLGGGGKHTPRPQATDVKPHTQDIQDAADRSTSCVWLGA